MNANEYFENNYFSLSEEALLKVYEANPFNEGLVRFFKSLENYVFCVMMEDSQKDNFLLIYAEYNKDFNSIGISIPIEDYQMANEVTVILAREINIYNEDKYFFNVYNMFQSLRRSALEALGYFTINPFTAPEGTLLSVGQKIARVEILDRVDFLRSIYQKNK